MTIVFHVEQIDPTWRSKLSARRAILWIARAARRDASALSPADIHRLICRPWGAIVDDSSGYDVSRFNDNRELPGLVLRTFEAAPPERLPANRIPIFRLPAIDAPVRERATRFEMIDRLPAGCDVFVLGPLGPDALRSLAEAVELSESVRILVALSPASQIAADGLSYADRITIWDAPLEQTTAWIRESAITGVDELRVLARISERLADVSIQASIDQSDSITQLFDIVPAGDALNENAPDLRALMDHLEDPTKQWAPYGTGAVFPRSDSYFQQLQTLLKQVSTDGSSGARAVQLVAESGSGSTTVLRDLALRVARLGYPSMVAKPSAIRFDQNQLAQFLTRASDQLADAGVAVGATPWLICFDTEHVERSREFILELSSALRKLLKPALVLWVSDSRSARGASQSSTKGVPHLKPPMRNAVDESEAYALGEHLARILPSHLRRTRAQWRAFLMDSVRSSPEGGRSLFWVALRFWLLYSNEAGMPLRTWLYKKVTNVCGGDPVAVAALLEIATIARSRLDLPLAALEAPARRWLRLVEDDAKLLGLEISVRSAEVSATLSHPLVAEELLRIALEHPEVLAAVGRPDCVNLLDLELTMLERILPRDALGASDAGISMVEELVTSSLRVDPREAPRTWGARERIVQLLERVPDGVWDQSQVFNHHVAIARKHVAVEPQSAQWSTDDRREQFELAENHLLDALENLSDVSADHRERKLNLHVSYAVMADARASFEASAGNAETAGSYRERAAEQYRAAEREDADSTYVLENFARHKLSVAESASPEERCRLAVEAVQLLQRERATDTESTREAPIVQHLSKAYEMLEAGSGRDHLMRWAAAGSEAAVAALAWLELDRGGWLEPTDAALRSALLYLERLPLRSATRVSLELRYRVESRLKPYAFPRRLELLDALRADDLFAWPLQYRLEYAVLMFQVGDDALRRRGKEAFDSLRRDLPERSGSISVPEDLRYLRDAASEYLVPLVRTMTAKARTPNSRNRWATISGWTGVDVAFRDLYFGTPVGPGEERDCLIEFSNLGPQAVPPTAKVER